MEDELGKRIKSYEKKETRKLDRNRPIYAKIEGRAFHSFTKGMARPFDVNMTDCMIETAKDVLKKTDCSIAYTQGGEINLIFYYSRPETELLYSGNVSKLTAVLASYTTACFIKNLFKFFYHESDSLIERIPHFDCRVFNVPSKSEAANALLWRVMDTRKDSIWAIARSYYTPAELNMKSQDTIIRMIKEAGYDINNYEKKYLEGTFLRKKIETYSEKNTTVTRTVVSSVDMPLFNRVTNRIGVIFDKEEAMI